MMRFRFLILVALGVLFGSTGVQAGTIYDNGGPLEGGTTAASDLDPIGDLFQEAIDDFILTSTATVTGINWWGAYTPRDQVGSVPDDFSFRIFNDLLEIVADINVGAVSRLDTGLDNGLGLSIFAYEATFSPLFLDPGTYWLSIVNNTIGDLDNERWSWQSTEGIKGESGRFRQSVGGPIPIEAEWTGETEFDFAFAVQVPEPGTLALLVLGLAGMRLARRGR